ncbi:MAG: sugar ABC transporter permease, partial [Thermoleophilia bacterium]|nr:sugar ABC transporter permease [Thermoleophilia bacterium]
MAILARGWRRDLSGWALVGPVVVGTLLFNIIPILPTIYYSLTDWTGLARSGKWVGLENYVQMFRDDLFYTTLARTFAYMAGTVTLGYLAGLGLALLANSEVR